MPADDYSVVNRADKRSVGKHERQFNGPVIDEVANVMVGQVFELRDKILRRRSRDVQRVSETVCLYDELQYPNLFWREVDLYQIGQICSSHLHAIQYGMKLKNFC